MNSNEGALDYELILQDQKFQTALRNAENQIHGLSSTALTETTKMDSMFKNLGFAIAGFFSVQAAQRFVSELTHVRGEFQQLDIAMTTMLGSKEKANALMAQLVQTAATTPFSLTEVSQGAKQLLAYGTAADDINDTLTRLGNIASGLSIPLGDLVYLYGTTQTQGRLFTQDVRQFMGRGIPLVQELAKEMGKTTQEVNDLVTAGKIGFPEVQKVIQNMTNQGGMFFDLMKKQSGSLTGQISNLGDAFDVMLNQIGTQSEGVLSKSIELTADLIENYKPILAILGTMAIAYGAYKAALIVTSVVEEQSNILHAIGAVRIKALAVQQGILNKVMSLNPWAVLVAGLTVLAGAIYYQNNALVSASSLQKEYNDRLDESAGHIAAERAQVGQLIQTAENEKLSREQRIEALTSLNKISPEYFSNLTLEKNGLLGAAEASNKYTAALYAQAQMQAKTAQIQDNAKKRTTLQTKIDTNDFGTFENIGSADRWFGGGLFASADDRQKLAAQAQIDDLNKQDAVLQKSLQEQMEKVIPKTEQELTNWVARKQEEQKKVGRFSKQYRELQKQINEGMSNLAAGNFTSAPQASATTQNKAYWEAQLKDAQDQYDALDKIGKATAAGVKLAAQITVAQDNISSYSIKTPKPNDKELKAGQQFADKKRNILDNINNIEQQYLAKSISQDDAEVMATKEKFAAIIKTIEDYNRKAPKGAQITAGTVTRVQNVADKVVGGIQYGQQTDAIKTELERRKSLLKSYEDWKDEFGKASADKQFGEDLANYKTHLQKEVDLLTSSEDYKNNYFKQARVKMLKGLQTDQAQMEIETARQTLETALKTTQSTEESILAIKKKYQKEADALKADGSLTPDRQAILDDNQQTEVNALVKGLLDKEKEISNIGDNIAGVTKNQIRTQIEALKEYLASATNLTDNQKQQLQNTIASLSQKMLTATDGDYTDNTSLSGVKQLQDIDTAVQVAKNNIKDINEAISKLKINNVVMPGAETAVEDLNTKIVGINVQIKELQANKLQAFGEIMKGIGGITDSVADNFKDVDKSISEALKTLALFVNTLGSVTSGIGSIKAGFESLQTAQSFAGVASGVASIGAGVGSVIGAVGTVVGIFTSARASAKAAAQEQFDAQQKILGGEFDYNQLLAQRALMVKQLNDGTLKSIQLKQQELELQLKVNAAGSAALDQSSKGLEKDITDLTNKIVREGKEVIGTYTKKTGLGKTETGNILSEIDKPTNDLAHSALNPAKATYNGKQQTLGISDDLQSALKTYDVLKKLHDEGLLDANTDKQFELLEKQVDAYNQALQQQQELTEAATEAFSGTTAGSIADSIIDGFKQGKRSIEDFADDFNTIISNSILSTIKDSLLGGAVQQLWADFQKFTEENTDANKNVSPLTDAQKAILQGDWTNGITDTGKAIDAMNSALGIDITKSSAAAQSSSLTGQIKGITQDTASELAGLYRTDVDLTRRTLTEVQKSNVMFAQQMNHLADIKINTANTVDRLDKMLPKLDNIVSNTKTQSTRGLNTV